MVAAVCTLAVLAVAPAAPATAQDTRAVATALPPAAEIEQQFFDRINATREQNGRAPLVRDPALSVTAVAWSQHMRDTGVLAHDPNLAAVVTAIDPTWTAAAENVGTGFDVAGVYQAFIDSPTHLANILGGSNRLGLGVVVDGGRLWVTQRFLAGAPLPPDPIDPPPAGTDAWFHALPPGRILDTRDGTGLLTGPSAVGPGGVVTLDVTGVAGVPAAGVSAVLLNVTVTGATATTHLTVFPSGTSKPASSNLNVAAGETVANMVDARVGSDGQIRIANNSGSVHVIADVAGYFDDVATGGSRFNGVDPVRVMDSRDGTGTALGKLGPGGTRTLALGGIGPVPGAGVSAVALSVTAVSGSAASHLTVWPGGLVKPNASSLNFPVGRTVPNLVVVPLGAGGAVQIANNSGNVHVLVDVMGYFSTTAGGGHTPVVPTRLRDTRFGPGPIGKVGAGAEIAVTVNGSDPGADAVVLNVTALDATVPTHVTVYPQGTGVPASSNVNLVPGQVKPVLVLARVGTDGKVRLRNNSGSVNLIVDVLGTFDAP